MAAIDTTSKWREAVSQLNEEGYFGSVILSLEVGDFVVECLVLDDATNTDITPDTPTLEAALDRANTGIAADTQQLSFIDAMQPIIKDWHQGTMTTTQALAASNIVLDNHTAHKSVMNTVIWANMRLIVNPLADVTLANISGNANAEAAYLMALFDYVSRVKIWRV